MVDVAAYLERVAYSGSRTLSADTLRDIHRAHLFSVPFENLDIGWGREIRMDQESFVRKIVEHHRGGFCYELNGAFSVLLQALGFQVTLLSARVPLADGRDSPEFDHLTLRVDLNEPWVADAGFGDCFVDPLRLQIGLEQEQQGKWFRIVQVGEFFETGEARGGSRLENSVLVRSKIKTTGGIRGDVPLPPDFAAISFHEKARVQPSYARRAYHPVGNEADHDQRR